MDVMKNTSSLHRSPAASGGFTLIELLVVISIIALLAGIAMPVYQTALTTAQENDAMSRARQIGMALRAFANDQGGAYVTGTNSYGQAILTSNDAFRSLIPTYLDSEGVFVVPGTKDGPRTDNIIDPFTQILKPGENHFAYIEGLSETSSSLWPLVVDGAGANGKYTTDQGQLGGMWKGTKAVVINCDSSAHLVPLMGAGSERYIPRFDDPTQDELDVSSYMGSDAQLLEPALP
jgi:prepilin-type N-terminal cleavage/methylation domain-containing protein